MPDNLRMSSAVEPLLAELRYRLRVLHRQNGEPSTREIARRTDKAISHTTANTVLRCQRIPSWGQLELLTEVLGGDPNDFRELWVSLRNAADPIEAAGTERTGIRQVQDGDSQDHSLTDPNMYSIDLCLCLEMGSGTGKEVDRMLERALRLPTAIVARMVGVGRHIAQTRIRYIFFGIDASALEPHYDSGFLQFSDMEKIDFAKLAPRLPTVNPTAAKALKLAFNSEWRSPYSRCRHIVGIWATSVIPDDGDTMRELLNAWERNSTGLSPGGRRLIIFAPDAGGWTSMANEFEMTLHYTSAAGDGLGEKDFSSIIDAIVLDV